MTPVAWRTAEVCCDAVGHAVKEKTDWHVQNTGQVEQARSPDPVYTAFVLLHLLEARKKQFGSRIRTPTCSCSNQGNTQIEKSLCHKGSIEFRCYQEMAHWTRQIATARELPRRFIS